MRRVAVRLLSREDVGKIFLVAPYNASTSCKHAVSTIADAVQKPNDLLVQVTGVGPHVRARGGLHRASAAFIAANQPKDQLDAQQHHTPPLWSNF